MPASTGVMPASPRGGSTVWGGGEAEAEGSCGWSYIVRSCLNPHPQTKTQQLIPKPDNMDLKLLHKIKYYEIFILNPAVWGEIELLLESGSVNRQWADANLVASRMGRSLPGDVVSLANPRFSRS